MGGAGRPAGHGRRRRVGDRRRGECAGVAAAALGLLLVVVVLAAGGPRPAAASGVDKRIWGMGSSKLSGLIIPGFASTRLRAWTMLDCPYSPLNFEPLDPVWIDVRKVLSVLNCWMKCMVLDPVTQGDHPECKSRPDSGLSAITELDPGYLTGSASSVWREWVNWCVDFGIDADAIVAAPYDWRLPGPILESRDLYFHKLKISFETSRKQRGGPALVFAHSLGNNVFRYFLEWLRLEIAPKGYQQWVDDHIHAYFAVGTPLLGSAETIKAMLFGLTFGLPIGEAAARVMSNSFAASIWMLPLSPRCHAHPNRRKGEWSDAEQRQQQSSSHFKCTEEEHPSEWPVDVVTVDLPPHESVAYPQVDTAIAHCGLSEKRTYTAAEISDGTFLREIAKSDPSCNTSLGHLIKFYLEDPVMNPLTPWDRPPIKNVYCAYGVDLKTEVGYHFAPTGRPYPDNWFMTDILYESEGGQLSSRLEVLVGSDEYDVRGTVHSFYLYLEEQSWKDERVVPAEIRQYGVPYHSLAYCKNWLGAQVNITRTPQRAHDLPDVQQELNVEHAPWQDIAPNMTREKNTKYVTFYEDGISRSGKRTAVWELDKVSHRNIVRSPVFLREIWLETVNSYRAGAKRAFVSKDKRDPLRDEDCYWDYGRARCGFPDRCEYRYLFGDIHLGQSCRLKASENDLLLQYLGG